MSFDSNFVLNPSVHQVAQALISNGNTGIGPLDERYGIIKIHNQAETLNSLSEHLL